MAGLALGGRNPILYFDWLFVKSRHEGAVKSKAVYVALGGNLQGEKEFLGLWISETEGTKFWLAVFADLQRRGVTDCFVACLAFRKPWRRSSHKYRSNSVSCIRSDSRCGMCSGESGAPLYGIYGRFTKQRCWREQKRRWSSLR